MTMTVKTKPKQRKRSKPRKKARKAPRRDKFIYYQESVQNPRFEVDLFLRIYRKTRGKAPQRLREDFAGTAFLACEWVRKVKGGEALAVDNHAPTLEWGRKHNLSELGPLADQVHLLNSDVLDAGGFAPDVTAAVNFSYFVFKTRPQMYAYFKAVLDDLAKDGVFIIDLYGGPEAQTLQEESTEQEGFTYIWDQDRYNPVTGETLCHIHFDFPDGTRMRKAFTYDWRLWTLPELTDLLEEVGFKQVTAYWDGTDRESGEGNGVYRVSTKGDSAESWVAYIAAAK